MRISSYAFDTYFVVINRILVGWPSLSAGHFYCFRLVSRTVLNSTKCVVLDALVPENTECILSGVYADYLQKCMCTNAYRGGPCTYMCLTSCVQMYCGFISINDCLIVRSKLLFGCSICSETENPEIPLLVYSYGTTM